MAIATALPLSYVDVMVNECECGGGDVGMSIDGGWIGIAVNTAYSF